MADANPAVVSSSSTLWATPSKEWVIPAKPKPGRKPKKDITVQPEETTEVDSKGRRVQNRAAQRAFRERKQSQLAELQARVQQYEQNEVERNVQLQNIAKKLKEENERLKDENVALKEKVERLQQHLAIHEGPKKRSRDTLSQASMQANSRKKIKTSPGPSPFQTNGALVSTPSSIVSSPTTTEGHSGYSPMPPFLPNQDVHGASGLGSLFDAVPETKHTHSAFDATSSSTTCGFCNEAFPCVCGDMQLEQSCQQLSLNAPAQERTGTISLTSPSSSRSQASILDNLPAYQPPVPIRRRSTNPSFNPVFPVYASTSDPPRGIAPSCSGDPSNCLACADDAFGKAFCDAISKSVSQSSGGCCKDCPERTDLGALPGCCGNPNFCGSSICGTPSTSSAPVAVPEPAPATETMPTDHAWRQIKMHPNVAFTDLSLLADVVARRTKCVGPRVELGPPSREPEVPALSPAVGTSPAALPALAQSTPEIPGQGVLLTDPHAHYHESRRRAGASPPPRLVPQEVLIRCGRQRVREVMADGVRDALRLLDSKFSIP